MLTRESDFWMTDRSGIIYGFPFGDHPLCSSENLMTHLMVSFGLGTRMKQKVLGLQQLVKFWNTP